MGEGICDKKVRRHMAAGTRPFILPAAAADAYAIQTCTHAAAEPAAHAGTDAAANPVAHAADQWRAGATADRYARRTDTGEAGL